jgi:hypothetical protein
LGTEHGTVQRVAQQLGYGIESVRSWARQADIDEGHLPGVTVVGDVLLGSGARSVKEALQWAAAARAVVVLIRGGEDDDTAFKGAAEGVVVMTVDPAVSWSGLAAVVLRIGVSRP